MSTIGLHHLKPLAVFAAVVDEGSFAAAARLLRTSRSRVSEQISQLEEDLDVRLLQRSTRKLALTEEGRQVYERARQLASILEETHDAISQEKPSGRVAITATHDIGVSFLLPAFQSFREAYPEISLDIMLSDDKLDLISEGIDLGLRVGLPRDDSLVGKVLYEDCLSIFASPDYLKTHPVEENLKQLSEHHWIALTYISPGGVHRIYEGEMEHIIETPRHEMCNAPLMQQKMVIAGMGLGLLFPSTVREEIASGQLVPVLPHLKTRSALFSLVYPSRKHLPLRTRLLIEHLLKADLF